VSVTPKTYNAFLLAWCQLSHIKPAIVLPLPTPAPSPIKNPALLSKKYKNKKKLQTSVI